MFIQDGHLTATDAGTDIRHTVVVANCLVLVVGIRLAGLGGIPKDFVLQFGIVAHQRTAAGGGNHLVAIEGKHAIASEGAEYLPFIARAEAFCRVFHHGNAVLVGNRHDTVAVVGHTIQCHRDNGFGVFAGRLFAVENRLL